MVVELRNKIVPVFVLVERNHSQPKFVSIGKENAGIEEVECRWGGDSQIIQLSSKAAIGR